MKIAYTAPAKGESYTVERKAAARVVRELCPELPLLAFQTMHVPKMDSETPYLATLSVDYIRVLSVSDAFLSANVRMQFLGEVLPYLCHRVVERRRVSYNWPSVIVIYEGVFREVSCSDGGLFPSREEIAKRVKKNPASLMITLRQDDQPRAEHNS